MAELTCKTSVRFKGFTRGLVQILIQVLLVADYTTDVAEVVITSANDSRHGARSRHYTNEALDLRSRNFSSSKTRNDFIKRLRRALGPRFTILYEGHGTPNAHIHVQPRKGTTYTGPLCGCQYSFENQDRRN